MMKKLTMFGLAVTLIIGAFLLFGPSTAVAGSPAKPHLPPIWQATPVQDSHATSVWVDDHYYGNCRDKNNTIQCGDVWHKQYSNGNRSNPFLDKQILCAGITAGEGCPNKRKSEEKMKNLDQEKQ